MEAQTITLYRYRLSTTYDVRTQARVPKLDPDLDIPPLLTSQASAGPKLVEFVLEVILEGLPLGELIAPSEDSQEPAKPDALRQYATVRLARLKPVLTRELEEEIRRLAKRHLGERGWMIDEVEIEIGSMKLAAGFLISLEVFTNYGAIRESMEYIHQDLVTYAIPAGKEITQRLLNLDTAASGQAADNLTRSGAAATATAQTGQRYEMASSDPEVAALLKQVVGELRELRAAIDKEGASEGKVSRLLQERRASEAEVVLGDRGTDVKPGS